MHHPSAAGSGGGGDPIRRHQGNRRRPHAFALERSRWQSAAGRNRTNARRKNGFGAQACSHVVETLMLNWIWLALVVLAVAIGGWNNRLNEVTAGAFDGAKTAVTIALGLIGIMALWLGVMRLAERAGLVQRIARGLHPVMRRLFPDFPPYHPAVRSVVI